METKKFNEITRIPLAPLNTPVEPLERLTASIKGAPNLFIKRDDFIGPLVWGNKLRKLEYSFGAAKEAGADVVITCGAVQSNHARTTSMVARRLGIESLLVLNGVEPETARANYLISKMMASKILIVPDKDDRQPAMEEAAKEYRGSGRNPFIIPLGASDMYGTPGFVRAMIELRQQQESAGIRFSHIVVSSSSGGTQGGMEAGKRIAVMQDIDIIGISADESCSGLCKNVVRAANPILQMTGFDTINDSDLFVDDRFTGSEYGKPTAESEKAAELFLTHEGILLDHTYTAKAAAGMLKLIEEGRFSERDNVLFWHTGGLLNLF